MNKIAKIIILIGLVAFTPSTASAVVIDLGDASKYAVLSMKQDTDAPSLGLTSDSSITGDVGIGPGTNSTNGSYSKSSGASVVGKVFLAPGTDTSGVNGPNGGTFVLNSDLSSAIADALQAASDVGALGATQIFGNITTTQTINGNGGINVISATKIDLSGNKALTLNGTPSEYFIFKLTEFIGLSGTSDIVFSGGVSGSHVLYYVSKTTSNGDHNFVVEVTGDSTMNGTILAPFGDIKFHGQLLNGALIGNDINLGSHGDLTYLPFQPTNPPSQAATIPEPASVLLLAIGLLGARHSTRRRFPLHSSAPFSV